MKAKSGWLMKAVRWVDRKIVSVFGGTRNIKLAQGLEIVLVVLHKRLSVHFAGKFPGRDRSFQDSLATAVLDKLFALKKVDPRVRKFMRDNRLLVEKSLGSLGEELPELCSEITLALYVRGILDEPVGGHSRALFARATELGIFSPDVTIPQPKEYLQHAVELARNAGIGSAD